MFLTKENHIRWIWLAVAFLAVAALCVWGIFWADVPMYLYLRQFDWVGWGVLDTAFSFGVWLVVSAVAMAVFGTIFYSKKIGWGDGHKNNARTKEQSTNKTSFFASLINFGKNIWGFIVKTWTRFADFIKSVNDDSSALGTAARTASFVFFSVLAAGVIVAPLKFAFGRMRPVFLEALDQVGFVPFTNDWAFNGFPSGHAAAGFAGLVMIGLLFPRIKWATWTLAVIIGVSRVFAGDHFPSDVLAGAFIGMVSADLVKFMLQKIAKSGRI
ncbi:MAG: phosphatase PAP2 family protein [Proteobacteria bacterium]|nr:phosphatase PAP2 family protein [Pseudomonadota bacterium]